MTTFEEIYQAYSQDVQRFAYWLCGDVSEAEDIVSETFLRLWGSLDELRATTVKAYLLSIARNVFISRRRRTGWEKPLADEAFDRSQPPDMVAEQKDDVRALMNALQTLPEGERAALLMRVQQELPYDEIARILGISLSAVKVRIHRARLKLTQQQSQKGAKP